MLELILAALAGFVINIVLTVVVLAFEAIVDWFVQRIGVMGENDLAFTLKQTLENGRYKVVQGIFDQASGEVSQARRINATRFDSRFAATHAQDDLAVYA